MQEASPRRWLALGTLLLLSCTEHHPPPVATAVQQPPTRPVVLIGPPSLLAWAVADSIAASYGFQAGLSPDGEGPLPAPWPDQGPAAAPWQSLMPGRLPGLQAWLKRDSLYTGDDPYYDFRYTYELRYPAFSGPRSEHLKRTLGHLSGLPDELAEVRRQRRRFPPFVARPQPADADQDEVLACEHEETNTLECFTLGACVVGTDTVVSTAGTTYNMGHCAHGSVDRVTGNFSLRQQRQVGFAELFRPTLRRALYHTVAAYVHWHEQQRWRDTRRAQRQSYAGNSLYWPLQQLQDSVSAQQRHRQTLGLLRQPSLPYRQYPTFSGDSFSNDGLEEQFYFGPAGLVFIIGSDLGAWKLLLPYSALPQYLCDVENIPKNKPLDAI